MYFEAVKGLLIPFIGTALGSACVFFLRNSLNVLFQQALTGFAAGVMVAASVWSLIIPSIDLSGHLGIFSFFPATVGFWAGILFLLILDKIIPHFHASSGHVEGPKSNLNKSSMLVFAVFLHNFPEGMAVGVAFAGVLSGMSEITLASALALSIGIGIQNFPEGAIISLPLASEGEKKSKAFLWGVLSGVVELLGAVVTILAAGFFTPLLPYFLSFAAGAMIYAVVEELIPEASHGDHSDTGTLMFGLGFTIMMILDVALG